MFAQLTAQSELDAYINDQAQAIAPEPSLPAGYTFNCTSDLFGTLNRIYSGNECIGTFGKVGTSDRYWVNSKLYSVTGAFPTQQAAADKLVQLWEKDCPVLAQAA